MREAEWVIRGMLGEREGHFAGFGEEQDALQRDGGGGADVGCAGAFGLGAGDLVGPAGTRVGGDTATAFGELRGGKFVVLCGRSLLQREHYGCMSLPMRCTRWVWRLWIRLLTSVWGEDVPTGHGGGEGGRESMQPRTVRSIGPRRCSRGSRPNREDDHDHNHVNTRKELVEYDPAVAKLCEEVFGKENPWVVCAVG